MEVRPCVKWSLKRVKSLDKSCGVTIQMKPLAVLSLRILQNEIWKFCKKYSVDFCHFWVWKGESISGSSLGLLHVPTILTCLTWSNSAVVFFCVEPDVGMPLHQAQRYFKQLIDGVVGQSLIPNVWRYSWQECYFKYKTRLSQLLFNQFMP